MATNAELNALLGQVPIADLAERFGVDEGTVEAAVRQALPGLLGGMAVNASAAEGASSLERAVQQHAPASEKPRLQAIDTEDGKKIVGHVLGDKRDQVAHALGERSGDSGIADLIPKLLPILAPIIMQFLAGKLGGGSASGSTSAGTTSAGGGLGGVLGDLLGGLLGGGQTAQQQSGSGGDLGDVLGGLLGGGSGKSGSGGGLGDLLGGILGK